MLFWIEGELSRLADFVSKPQNTAGLSNLINSAITGDHVLLGPRDYLNALINSGFFSEKEISYLAVASQKLTQVGRVVDPLPKIRISADYEREEKIGQEWLMPLSFFENANALRVPFLLAENIRDSRIYMAFAQKWMDENISPYIVRYIPVHGGGHPTAEVFAGYIRDGHPSTKCIVDSDKKHLGDKIGQTASSCLKQVDGVYSWQFSLEVLRARELENLIPVKMREDILTEMSLEHRHAHELLIELPDSVRLYLCLKDGDCLCRFYENGYLNNSGNLVCSKLNKSGTCERISGFGHKFLLRVLDNIYAGKSMISPSKEWNVELVDVISSVSVFGLGSEPHRLIAAS